MKIDVKVEQTMLKGQLTLGSILEAAEFSADREAPLQELAGIKSVGAVSGNSLRNPYITATSNPTKCIGLDSLLYFYGYILDGLSSSAAKMITPSQSQYTLLSSHSTPEIESVCVQYRGWPISTKVIDGQMWLRWQHPQESFPRYGCPVDPTGMASTINHVRFLIDLAIKLEEGMPKNK